MSNTRRVCRMTRPKIKITKVAKWPLSNYIASAGMHVIKRIMVNYDRGLPQDIVWILTGQNVLYSFSLGVTWPSLLRAFHLRQTNFASYELSGSPVRGLFILIKFGFFGSKTRRLCTEDVRDTFSFSKRMSTDTQTHTISWHFECCKVNEYRPPKR